MSLGHGYAGFVVPPPGTSTPAQSPNFTNWTQVVQAVTSGVNDYLGYLSSRGQACDAGTNSGSWCHFRTMLNSVINDAPKDLLSAMNWVVVLQKQFQGASRLGYLAPAAPGQLAQLMTTLDNAVKFFQAQMKPGKSGPTWAPPPPGGNGGMPGAMPYAQWPDWAKALFIGGLSTVGAVLIALVIMLIAKRAKRGY